MEVENAERESQWRYFDLPLQLFEQDFCSNELIGNVIFERISFYRSLLYGLCRFRNFIEFDFNYNKSTVRAGTYQDPRPWIEVTYGGAKNRDEFFQLILKNFPKDRKIYKVSRGTKQDACRRVNEIINAYFFEVINDLASVSQDNGLKLLKSIYPPGMVQSYYNIMIISKILFAEYKKYLCCYGEEHNVVKDFQEFLHGSARNPGVELLDIIWDKFSESSKYSRQTFLTGLKIKFHRHKNYFCQELNHLQEPNIYKSGPKYCSSPHPTIWDENYHTRNVPSYMVLKSDGRMEDRFRIYKNYLREWKYGDKLEIRPQFSSSPRRSETRKFEKSSKKSSLPPSLVDERIFSCNGKNSTKSDVGSVSPRRMDLPRSSTSAFDDPLNIRNQIHKKIHSSNSQNSKRVNSKKPVVEDEARNPAHSRKKPTSSEKLKSLPKEPIKTLSREEKIHHTERNSDVYAKLDKNSIYEKKFERIINSDMAYNVSSNTGSIRCKTKRELTLSDEDENICSKKRKPMNDQIVGSIKSEPKNEEVTPETLGGFGHYFSSESEESLWDEAPNAGLSGHGQKGKNAVMNSRRRSATQTLSNSASMSGVSNTANNDYAIDNFSQGSGSMIGDAESNDFCNNEFSQSPRVSDIQQSLLFKSISCVLSKNMSPEFNQKYFYDNTKFGHFDSTDKKLFLTFLYHHRFLCDFTNPSLYKILCHFKFLGRTETLPYENFVYDLRSNLAMQLEELFTEPEESDLMFAIYEKLREIYF